MKHYSAPVIELVYYGQTDVICASEEYVQQGVTSKDNDVQWGGNWQ